MEHALSEAATLLAKSSRPPSLEVVVWKARVMVWNALFLVSVDLLPPRSESACRETRTWS
jgi:hypothetical protein